MYMINFKIKDWLLFVFCYGLQNKVCQLYLLFDFTTKSPKYKNDVV